MGLGIHGHVQVQPPAFERPRGKFSKIAKIRNFSKVVRDLLYSELGVVEGQGEGVLDTGAAGVFVHWGSQDFGLWSWSWFWGAILIREGNEEDEGIGKEMGETKVRSRN